MKKFTHILISVFVLAILLAPVFSFAQTPLIPCGTDAAIKIDPANKECNFQHFLTLINNIINFTIKYLALPLAAIMFAYAGVLLVTSQGGEGKTKAKGIFLNTVLGLVVAVGAWLIVKTLLSIAGYQYTSDFF